MDDKELYAEAFIYPSQEEWKEIVNSFPIIKEIAFKGSNSVKDDLYEDEFYKFVADNDIQPWINRLNNKLSKLRFSYVLLKYYNLKGILHTRWVEHLKDGTTNAK